MKYLIGILLTVLSVSPLFGDDVYKIYPFSQKIQIDGKAKEQIWNQLPFSEFFVPTNGNAPLKCSTRFKLYSDKEFVFILIELKGQTLSDIKGSGSLPLKEKQKLLKDNITLFIAPRPEIDDHYKITVDFNGYIEDCFLPEKSGHGYLADTTDTIGYNITDNTSNKVASLSTTTGTINLGNIGSAPFTLNASGNLKINYRSNTDIGLGDYHFEGLVVFDGTFVSGSTKKHSGVVTAEYGAGAAMSAGVDSVSVTLSQSAVGVCSTGFANPQHTFDIDNKGKPAGGNGISATFQQAPLTVSPNNILNSQVKSSGNSTLAKNGIHEATKNVSLTRDIDVGVSSYTEQVGQIAEWDLNAGATLDTTILNPKITFVPID